jgi:hypothetical protein
MVMTFDTPGRLRDLPSDSPLYASWRAVLDELIRTRVVLSGPGFSIDPSKIDLDVRERRITYPGSSHEGAGVTAP